MNFKSLLTSLFVLVYSFSAAQESIVNNYFSSASIETLYCGGKLIAGSLYSYQSSINSWDYFSEDNRFFIEIELDSNSKEYTRIPASRLSLSSPNQAEFMLPDNLEIGKKYRIRMISTSPSLQGNFVSFVYAAGMLPFNVDLEQYVVIEKNQPAYLNYIIKKTSDSSSILDYVNRQYNFELSDGFKVTIHNEFQNLNVFPVDSVTTYKIKKVTNICGTEGVGIGMAEVKWQEAERRINIKTIDGNNEVCHGVKFGLKVESNFITAGTDITVEFSIDYDFPSTFTVNNLRVDKDNVLWVDIPDQKEDFHYFYCRVKTSATYSNRLTLRKLPKIIKAIPTFALHDINVGRMTIRSENSQGNSIYGNIKSIEINGEVKNYEGLYFEHIEFPMPKKDTTFVVSKVVTACGSIPVEPRELKVSSDDILLLTTTYDKSEYCINENVTGKYTLSNPSHLANIDLGAYNIATGYFYSSETGNVTGNSHIMLFGDSPVSFDKEQQTFSAKVAGHMHSNLGGWVERDYSTVGEIILSVSPQTKTPINATLYHTQGINIKLPAEVWLTEKEVKAQNGFAIVPIKFLGEKVTYELSNGQKGEIELRVPNCYSCTVQNGGKTTLKIPVTESITLRFHSARNGCGEGKVYGETRIIVENDRPMLTIDESKVPEKVCSGTEIEVFFKKSGNWEGTNKVYLKTNAPTSIKERELTEEEINLGKIKFNVTSVSTYQPFLGNFWIECSNVKSNIIKIIAEIKPSFSNLSLSGRTTTGYDATGTEVKYVIKSSNMYNLEWYSYSGASSFVIDGKSIVPNRINEWSASYFQNLYIKKDTSFILNSVSNSCGTAELNKKFSIKPVTTLLSANLINLEGYYSYCEGNKAFIELNYQGIIPNSDNFVLELAKSDSRENSRMDFFNVPFKMSGKKMEFIIPENLSGYYYFRVKSTVLDVYSAVQSLGYINKKTNVSLVSESGQSEVLGTPGATLYLKPKSDEFSSFWVKLNNGEFYRNSDFNLYQSYGNNSEVLESRGKYFTPSETTTYSIQSVHDACGVGVADGTVKIVITPKVQLSLNNQKYDNVFCRGEEIDLNLTYFGEFPVDTLMGVYLHSFDNQNYNFELSTFKNKQGKLNIKLPSDIDTGHYFVQVRKKSKAKIFSTSFGNQISDKEKSQRLLNLDSEPLYVSLLSPPTIKLSGNTEIFEGNEATLNFKILNQNGEDLIEAVPYAYYQIALNDGTRNTITSYTSKDFFWYVSPKKTETYTIISVKNGCGTGKGSGSATVTVYPKTENRIETKGFLRTNSYQESYYNYSNEFCVNHSDSLDIEIYGKSNDLDLARLAIQLSDGEGANYRTIPVSKYLEVLPKYYNEDPEVRLIRLWFQFSSDIQKGDNYRIKAVLGNSDIPSTPLEQKVKISEIPTANLSGELMVVDGQNAIATVNFTGKSPWYVSITDENEQIVYNNIPKAISAKSEPTNTDLILKNNFPVEFSVDKTNIFKVSEVYNNLCGEGKPGEGTLRVSLVLSNELQSKIQVQIYPNPTQDLLYFVFKNVENNALIKLFDQSGRQVYNKEYLDNETKQRQTLSLEKLPQGIYLLNVSSGNFSQTYRVFKN